MPKHTSIKILYAAKENKQDGLENNLVVDDIKDHCEYVTIQVYVFDVFKDVVNEFGCSLK